MKDRKMRRKAVLVATDALKWLRKKSILVETGNSYMQLSGVAVEEIRLLRSSHSFQAVLGGLITPKRPCSICALGSLFLAHVDRFNKLPCGPIQQYGPVGERPFGSAHGFRNDVLSPQLSDSFDRFELSIIENAFESWNTLMVGGQVDADARAFGRKFEDPRKRLRAILRNIIENKGEFVPKAAAR